MRELRIKAGRRTIPIFDLPAALGRKQAAKEIGDQVDALIAFLDDLGGDPDLEDGEGVDCVNKRGRLLPGVSIPITQDEDREPDDDHSDASWPEWQTLPAATWRTGNQWGSLLPFMAGRFHEDDEDDDPPEDSDSDRDASGDDWIASGNLNCSDLIYLDEVAGDEADAERDGPAYWKPDAANDD